MKCMLLFVATLVGCDLLAKPEGDPNPPAGGKLTREAPVEVATQVIDPAGGTITVARPGDPLDGMTIDVQGGAYAEPRTFEVTSEVITAHSFGADFSPVSPLITIKNGGGYAGRPVILRIPVQVPEGHFAMGFLYDEASGTLEGMPILESGADHVTVFTMNFEHNLVSRGEPATANGALTWAQRRGALEDGTARSQIVMSAAPLATISGESSSGFRPGVDDSPSTNTGSYAEPQGFCAGSSIGAMWYFNERKQKAGAEPLWTRLDGDEPHAPAGFASDDVSGIRFGSMIQTGYGGPSFIDLVEMLGQTLAKDDVTLTAFKYAIKLTGGPQLAAIFTGPGGAGHAVTVYRADENALRVADPNFPGNTERAITYDPTTRAFNPFAASTRVGAAGSLYKTIFYVGRTSIVNWHRPAKHWAEVEAGTIGDGVFPEYTLRALDQNVQGAPLVDGFKVRDRRLSVIVASQGFESRWSAYDETGKAIAKEEGGDTSVLLPKLGKQWVGITISDKDYNWVGFDWVEVDALGASAPDCGGASCTDVCAGMSGMEGGFCLTDGTCECVCQYTSAGDAACQAFCGNPNAVCGTERIPTNCISPGPNDKHACLCSCE